MSNILSGYKTYASAIGVILAQVVGLIPGLNVPDDVINAISVILGIAACWFNKIGRDKLQKKISGGG